MALPLRLLDLGDIDPLREPCRRLRGDSEPLRIDFERDREEVDIFLPRLLSDLAADLPRLDTGDLLRDTEPMEKTTNYRMDYGIGSIQRIQAGYMSLR